MSVLVLDTHAVVWWTLEPDKLSAKAVAALRDATQLGVPSICFWEVSVLVRRRKLELDTSVQAWADAVRTIPRVRELALTADVAIRADALTMHADPADRFIVASALAQSAPLLTKDRLLRKLDVLRTVW